MPTIDALVETPVHRSFRVDQLAGMFDVSLEEKASERFEVELPADDEDWQIGLIVGPSGSGKSTIARHAFGKNLVESFRWPKEKAVVDGFGDQSIKEITHALTAVGFSSPPSWVKPYGVLSNGERFRCDLARALLTDKRLVAYDEFTSVVDRTVAKIGSAAVSKAIRKGKIDRRFVAITCHYDVGEWLEPDWVLDMASRRLARGRLRRPEIRLQIAPVHRSAWVLFRRHHYLSGNIATGCRSFAAFWDDEPVGFSAWMHRMTRKRRSQDMREHRTVVLPDYQGLGIGNRLSEFCASIWTGLGGRAYSTTGHPAMIKYRSASPYWIRTRLGMVNVQGSTGILYADGRRPTCSSGRLTGGFQYVGPPMDRATAETYAQARPARFSRAGSRGSVEDIVRRYHGCTVPLVARMAGISQTSARTQLGELVERGVLTRASWGKGRFAYYPAAES